MNHDHPEHAVLPKFVSQEKDPIFDLCSTHFQDFHYQGMLCLSEIMVTSITSFSQDTPKPRFCCIFRLASPPPVSLKATGVLPSKPYGIDQTPAVELFDPETERVEILLTTSCTTPIVTTPTALASTGIAKAKHTTAMRTRTGSRFKACVSVYATPSAQRRSYVTPT